MSFTYTMMSISLFMRRNLAMAVLAAGLLGLVAGCASRSDAQELPQVTVYKTPTCGCCKLWVDHLEDAGFKVRALDLPDLTSTKQRLGVPRQLTSCHTAVVDGYVVEGHVPADVVKQMLGERPDVTGIAVPGMPIGSPGMEVEGRPAEPYEVIAFDQAGGQQVYARR
jgi:hypothetical protein